MEKVVSLIFWWSCSTLFDTHPEPKFWIKPTLLQPFHVQTADDEICAQVAEQPQNYLVPHPADCKKFYSCQNLGWRGGWIAHLMDCPATTGFDTKLRICNYIKALPRCSKG